MKNKIYVFGLIIFFGISLLIPQVGVHADGEENAPFYADDCWQYQDADTGYFAVLWDDADLLTEEEEEWLIYDMIPITGYGHVVFSTDYQNELDTELWAEKVLRTVCDSGESGVVFEIDMTHRQLYIYSDGEIHKTVTKSYAYTITDNVYKYATDGRYYDCASEAFSQIFSLLGGKNIAQPMKHINNALLAVGFGILLNFIILNIKKKKNNKNAAKEAIVFNGSITALNVIPGPLSRVYNPPKSSSSGGGGGGGGRSGGGGGHSF